MPPKEGLLLINFYFIDKNLDTSTAGPNTSLSLVRCGNNVFQSDSCIANKLIERSADYIVRHLTT